MRGPPMSLSQRINAPKTAIHGFPCSVGNLLATLAPEDAEALNTMLSGTPERRWSQNEIYDILAAEGYEVGRQSINRHRAGRCRCFPRAGA